ncbi:hypothetical protein ACFQMA_16850 [Halosimplex aquaticum]|uniref:Uncharacterized protein n=1 Tax=Halosimplex aquaticum TaxID=3026162 RepID=A0ABD5Y6J3_9EURY|nr:hypothetical protein [Halosimplex aquaticum]
MDSDGDGLADAREREVGTDPTLPDSDDDGLTDESEVDQFDTDPLRLDTDGDSVNDSEEVTTHGTDPAVNDSDGDGLADGREVTSLRTEPTNPDTDGDGFADGAELSDLQYLNGSDPLRMDVFVEVDYVEGVQFKPGTRELVTRRYSEAPVTNPDGTNGISLHIIVDEEVPDVGTVDGQKVDKLQSEWFDRRGYGYHYAVAVKDVESDGNDVGGLAGHGPHGPWFVFNARGNYRGAASVFMHELGHSVGLSPSDYEGIDSRSVSLSKYPSTMNYNSGKYHTRYARKGPFDDWAHIAEQMDTPEMSAVNPGVNETRSN